MEIKRVYDDFLYEESGIVIDDAYDLYKKREYKKFIKDNKEVFIYSQDNCIDYLLEIPNIKYISLPRDVEDLNVLYELKNMEGLCIYSSSYNKLNLSKIKPLLKLKIIFDSRLDNDLLDVEELKLVGFSNSPKLSDLKFGDKLKRLELSFLGNLTILENIPSSLQSLTLDYCLKLRNISCITSITNLSKLQIFDCNKIENLYESLLELKCIKILQIYNKETHVVNHLRSVNFIDNMDELDCFVSDYLIDDNNLNPLLKIKNRELLRWKNKYNIKKNIINK